MNISGLLTIYLPSFLVLLTILVFVHEMGHYLVARWNGVKVEVFSIGFGPEIFGFTAKSGTRWKFSAIPLGGYVKMYGDANAASAGGDGLDTMTADERAVSFHHKTVGQRSAIVLAGPLANYLFALVVLTGLFIMVGQPFTPARIGVVTEGSPAAAAGLKTGDRVVAIDGRSIERYEEVIQTVRLKPETKLTFLIERQGRQFSVDVTPIRITQRNRFDDKSEVGRIGISPFNPPVVEWLMEDGAAAAAGFKTGDRILSVAGTKVERFGQMAQIVRSSPGKRLAFEVQRGGDRITLYATPKAVTRADPKTGETTTIGQLGVSHNSFEYRKYGVLTAMWRSVLETVDMTAVTATAIGQIVSGERSSRDLGGAIRIGEMSGQMAQLGVRQFIWFMAILSLNLCLINLLPVPMLDGGHLMFYAFEALRGKPLGERAQEYGFRIGLALVLTLMIFVTWNDILNLTEKIGL